MSYRKLFYYYKWEGGDSFISDDAPIKVEKTLNENSTIKLVSHTE